MSRREPALDIKQEILRHLDLALAACELAIVRAPMAQGRTASLAVSDSFRHLHSAKAISGLGKNSRVPLLLHGAETAASLIRRREDHEIQIQLRPLADALDLVRNAVRTGRTRLASEAIQRLVDRLGRERPPTESLSPPDLRSMIALDADSLDALTEYERHRLAANLRACVPLIEVKVRFLQSDFSRQIEDLRNRLMAVGEVIAMLPSIDPEFGETISFRIVLASRENDESLALLSPAAPVAVRNLLRGPLGETPKTARTGKIPNSASAGSATANPLLHETAVWLSRLSQTARTRDLSVLLIADLRSLVGRIAMSHSFPARLRAAHAKRIVRLAARLEATLRVPSRQVAVLALASGAQTAQALSRNVKFTISAAKVPVPAALADSLSVALVHLVRNAVVHGATPNSRRPTRVEILFTERKSAIEVTVRDDGKGIDAAALRAACARAGIDLPVNPRAADILRKIFDERLTLSPEANLITGRGAGLAAVQCSVKEARGSVSVKTRRGGGTVFKLHFPKRDHPLPCLLVEWGGRIVATPLVLVAEVIAFPRETFLDSRGVRRFKHRNRTLQIASAPARRPQALPAAASASALLIPACNRGWAFAVGLLGVERDGEFALARAREPARWAEVGMLRTDRQPALPVIDFARTLDFAGLIASNRNRE